MAIKTVTPVKQVLNTPAKVCTPVASDAEAGWRVKPAAADQKVRLTFVNSDSSNAETVVIKGGTFAPSAVGDLSFSIPASETYGVTVESGKYLQMTGDNAGYIIGTATADVDVACDILP